MVCSLYSVTRTNRLELLTQCDKDLIICVIDLGSFIFVLVNATSNTAHNQIYLYQY